jgi:O-succinylbenzoic acid--CoA ligase
VINVAGNKVHPEEVERKLNGYIAGEFMIIPFQDEAYGQGIGLVLTTEGNALSIEGFKAIEGIKAYEIPRKQTILDQLERNINDKLDRKSMIEAGKSYVWQPIL